MPKGKGKKKGQARLDRNAPMWKHDSSLLMRSFPDTQIWNFNSEHEPRFGQVNSKDTKIYNVVQSAVNRQWLTSMSGVSGVGIAWSLSGNVNQATTLTSLFDQYRIMQIEVWLKPSSSLVANTNVATLYTAIDYDDQVNPSSEAQMQQYANVTVTSINEGVYRRFRPHIAGGLYQSSLLTGYRNEESEWIDSATPSVTHYGFKALISGISGGTIYYDLTYRIWVQCRNIF